MGLGLGDYPLSRWFFNTLPSLYLYWRWTPLVPLLGVFGWWAIHLVWVGTAGPGWLAVVMGLALISTGLYANAFVHQNYNALGWLFLPLGLYGLSEGHWGIAALAWLGASFTSFTVVVMAGALSAVMAAYTLSLLPVLAMLPASVKLLTHLAPAVADGSWKRSLASVMKFVGMARKPAKYRRTKRPFRLFQLYYLVLYAQFAVAAALLTRDAPVLFLAGLGLFLLNSTLMRFADAQSLQMLMMSLGAMTVLQCREPWLLPSYWLLMSPLPLLLSLPSKAPVLDVAPPYAPFRIDRLIDGMEQFLAPVAEGRRVLMAFDNPGGVHERLFDGYRTLLELPVFVAARKGVLFMPNWWAVFEVDHEGAPEFWGRDVEAVTTNAMEWRADFVVVYEEGDGPLGDEWRRGGFRTVSRFRWPDYKHELGGVPVCSGPLPTWWLLERDEGGET